MSRRYSRSGFSVNDTTGARFDLALERFRSGQPFEFREVAFRLAADGIVHCIVESSWRSENVTPETATRDLDEGEAALRHLMDESLEFRAAVSGSPICHELVEDYGMGSTFICSRVDGVLEWAHGFPRSPSDDSLQRTALRTPAEVSLSVAAGAGSPSDGI